ncbi:MAG: low molecular weight protein-tyrosine-phosphatase [Weeksellaceae bacterium]
MNHKILMVCLGNICRSPLAEGIMRSKLGDHILIDSAGTGDWHAGEHPDRRAITVAKNHGVDISKLRARQVSLSDFDEFDLIFAMDESNFRNLQNLTSDPNRKSKIKMMLGDADVPDPYWGDAADFENVFQLLSAAIDEVIEQYELA